MKQAIIIHQIVQRLVKYDTLCDTWQVLPIQTTSVEYRIVIQNRTDKDKNIYLYYSPAKKTVSINGNIDYKRYNTMKEFMHELINELFLFV